LWRWGSRCFCAMILLEDHPFKNCEPRGSSTWVLLKGIMHTCRFKLEDEDITQTMAWAGRGWAECRPHSSNNPSTCWVSSQNMNVG
jgi:hypothetical protein